MNTSINTHCFKRFQNARIGNNTYSSTVFKAIENNAYLHLMQPTVSLEAFIESTTDCQETCVRRAGRYRHLTIGANIHCLSTAKQSSLLTLFTPIARLKVSKQKHPSDASPSSNQKLQLSIPSSFSQASVVFYQPQKPLSRKNNHHTEKKQKKL